MLLHRPELADFVGELVLEPLGPLDGFVEELQSPSFVLDEPFPDFDDELLHLDIEVLSGKTRTTRLLMKKRAESMTSMGVVQGSSLSLIVEQSASIIIGTPSPII